MRVLLLGEFSGLHVNLSKGLKELGINVTIASSGDGWKDYYRDVDLSASGSFRKIKLIWALIKNFHMLVGYDVVQLINPNFLDAKPNTNIIVFNILKRFNKAYFLGANGNDHFYIKYALTGKYEKSVFNYPKLREESYIKDYIEIPMSDKYKKYNYKLANIAKGITACCAEYEIAYKKEYGHKLTFIPLPFQTNQYIYSNSITPNSKIIFFLGHYKRRQALKGTDVIHETLLKLKENYPNDVELRVVDSVPFKEYQHLMNTSHILIDQLYSYGCGMNGVLGMAKGLIVCGGADPYMYKLMNDDHNKPLVYLPIDEAEMYNTFEKLIKNKNQLHKKALASREFAEKHHDHIKVARQYVDFWKSKI